MYFVDKYPLRLCGTTQSSLDLTQHYHSGSQNYRMLGVPQCLHSSLTVEASAIYYTNREFPVLERL